MQRYKYGADKMKKPAFFLYFYSNDFQNLDSNIYSSCSSDIMPTHRERKGESDSFCNLSVSYFVGIGTLCHCSKTYQRGQFGQLKRVHRYDLVELVPTIISLTFSLNCFLSRFLHHPLRNITEQEIQIQKP